MMARLWIWHAESLSYFQILNNHMFKIITTLLLCFSMNAFGAQQAPLPLVKCEQFTPYGFPTVVKQSVTKICREGYVLEHDNNAKIPVWVSYTLNPTKIMGCFPRADKYAADKSLKNPSTPKDYAKSNYDTGHIANAEDMRWSLQAQEDSFILSNMTPQLAGFNRGIWKKLEDQIRNWVMARKTTVLIYAGPIYDRKQDPTIGRSMVTVPSAFYKIVVDTKTKEVMTFLFPHESSSDDLETFMTSIAEVQKETGIIFKLPKDARVLDEPWPFAKKSQKKICVIN